MKIKIINDDGSIQGWFVALCTTAIAFLLPVIAFIGGENLQASLINISDYLKTIYPLSFGSWLAYKGVKAVFGKNGTTSQ
jgi:uncharacterized RDD family membrane protein YckC